MYIKISDIDCPGALLLTWNCLSIPKLQRLHCWSYERKSNFIPHYIINLNTVDFVFFFFAGFVKRNKTRLENHISEQLEVPEKKKYNFNIHIGYGKKEGSAGKVCILSFGHISILFPNACLTNRFIPHLTRWAIGGRWLQSPASQDGRGGKPDFMEGHFWQCYGA